MPDVPRTPIPRCAKHSIPMMWYGTDHDKAKYRCAICVANAKIKIDRLREDRHRRQAVRGLWAVIR